MSYEQILYSVADGVATITLNRPDKLNAWTVKMGHEVEHAVTAASGDAAVRVIVITGAGRSFCAGADLSLIQAVASGDSTDSMATPFNLYLLKTTKPVIAALRGNVVGMGLVLPLFCDVRLAASDARLSTAFAKLGLVAEWGVGWILPRIVGLSKALDLLYTARTVVAAEALQLGLVDRVFPDDDFDAEVQKYAHHLAANVSPRSLSIMRRQVYASLNQDYEEAAKVADAEMLKSFATEDCKEGITALLGRRAPQFTGQ